MAAQELEQKNRPDFDFLTTDKSLVIDLPQLAHDFVIDVILNFCEHFWEQKTLILGLNFCLLSLKKGLLQ